MSLDQGGRRGKGRGRGWGVGGLQIMTPKTLTDLTLKVVVVVLSNNDTGNFDRSDTEGGRSCAVK